MYALVIWLMMSRALSIGHAAARYQPGPCTDAVNHKEHKPNIRLQLPSRYASRPDAAW